MSKKIRWGVLGVARIATVKVIPAMQKGELSQITAIASRDAAKAEAAARDLGIPKHYGSYEALMRPASIREKSSSEFTSFWRRSALR